MPVVLCDHVDGASVGCGRADRDQRAALDLDSPNAHLADVTVAAHREDRLSGSEFADVARAVVGHENVGVHGTSVPPERTGRHVRQRVGFAAGQKHSGREGTDQASLVLGEQRAGVDACTFAHADVLDLGDGQLGEFDAVGRRADDVGERCDVVDALRGEQQPVGAVFEYQLDDLGVLDVVDDGHGASAGVLRRCDHDLEGDLGGVGEGQQCPGSAPHGLAGVAQGVGVGNHNVHSGFGTRSGFLGVAVGNQHDVGRDLALRDLIARVARSVDPTHGGRQAVEEVDVGGDDAVDALMNGRLHHGVDGARGNCA